MLLFYSELSGLSSQSPEIKSSLANSSRASGVAKQLISYKAKSAVFQGKYNAHLFYMLLTLLIDILLHCPVRPDTRP